MAAKSAVDRLPEDLRKRLIELLQDPSVTQLAITDIINAEAGGQVVSKSSVNRYAQRMERFTQKNRQAKEVAEVFLAQQGMDSGNVIGKVLNEQLRLLVFDLIGEIEELRTDGEKPVDTKVLAEVIMKVSRGLKELEQAEKLNAERSESIRQNALADAAKTVEQTAKAKGLSAETIDFFKRSILGL